MSTLKTNQKGFSLTELMITISIISTLGTVSAAKLNGSLTAARDANRKMNIRQVQTALELYYDDNLSYPEYQGSSSNASWSALKSALENPEKQYISELPDDPISKDKYAYTYWSDGNTFKISYELEDKNVSETQLALGI
ncbi:MAG: prepilin-type N-terminal cleavage/methylation domain-containing protein [bacterium]